MKKILSLALIFVLALSNLVLSQDTQTQELELFQAVFLEEIQEDAFAASFLEQVPFNQFQLITKQMLAQFGGLEDISGSNGEYLVTFGEATADGIISLDSEGKIETLLLRNPKPRTSEAQVSESQTSETQVEEAKSASELTSQTNLEVKRIEAVFTGEILEEDFTSRFLAQVPFAQIATITAQVSEQIGDFETVEGEDGEYRVDFTSGYALTQISLDAESKIQGLLLTDVIPNVADLDEAVAAFDALIMGSTQGSLLIQKYDGMASEIVVERNSDTPYAVGSAFKISVLATLQEEINAKKRNWTDVVNLQEQDKSFPSGTLHHWYVGAPLTLESAAALMISRSDNTATDLLIRTLGRETIESYLVKQGIVLNQPFLKTRELFYLKSEPYETYAESYRTASREEQLEILEVLAERARPAVSEILVGGDAPYLLEAEWYFKSQELCKVMAQVKDLELMHIEPGFVSRDGWSKLAYKGGSEPGVLNFSYWLEPTPETPETAYCVIVTLNDTEKAINERDLQTVLSGIVEVLKD